MVDGLLRLKFDLSDEMWIRSGFGWSLIYVEWCYFCSGINLRMKKRMFGDNRNCLLGVEDMWIIETNAVRHDGNNVILLCCFAVYAWIPTGSYVRGTCCRFKNMILSWEFNKGRAVFAQRM